MLSFWEKKNFIHYDYIIVGAGITGLSLACTLKEKNPRASVLLLERGLLPNGSSTKNMGIARMGSFSECLKELEIFGEEKFIELIEDRIKGMAILRKRLGDDNIDYFKTGGFELVLNRKPVFIEKLEYLNSILKKIFSENVFHSFPQLIDTFGFNKEMIDSVIINPLEGQINTGKLIQSLWNYAGILQVKIMTGAEVSDIEELADRVVVNVHSYPDEHIKFAAQKIALCTNAFTVKIYPQLHITPCRYQVLCTAPVDDLKFKGVFSFDEGNYYFRNLDTKIIISGGSHTDPENETTMELSINDEIQHQLE
ncbi:MAG: NAD(P)/FAD-dependent oxidoreductase, partial [Bacteroidia bacterium]